MPIYAPFENACRYVQALAKMSDSALGEWAPFAATLAQRLTRALAAKCVVPGDALWDTALDGLLLRAVDVETQARAIKRMLTCNKLSRVC